MQNRNADACLGADDFLPLLVWVLVQCNVLTAELEAEYMWGLLHPSLIPGEGGYYLTALCGAVHVLKSYKSSMEANTINGVKTLGSDNTVCNTKIVRFIQKIFTHLSFFSWVMIHWMNLNLFSKLLYPMKPMDRCWLRHYLLDHTWLHVTSAKSLHISCA